MKKVPNPWYGEQAPLVDFMLFTGKGLGDTIEFEHDNFGQMSGTIIMHDMKRSMVMVIGENGYQLLPYFMTHLYLPD